MFLLVLVPAAASLVTSHGASSSLSTSSPSSLVVRARSPVGGRRWGGVGGRWRVPRGCINLLYPDFEFVHLGSDSTQPVQQGKGAPASACLDLRWLPLLTQTCRRGIRRKNSHAPSEGENRSMIPTTASRKMKTQDSKKHHKEQEGRQHRMVSYSTAMAVGFKFTLCEDV